jgi:hypothetical protein
MHESARHLLICMSTDLRALVDLLMYPEKNFSVLPLELWQNGGSSSLAFYMLRTMRLSLRRVAQYGKYE